jgi:hypothetical protein
LILRFPSRQHQLLADQHDAEGEVHYLRKMLKQADHGFWFIAYLYGFQEEMDDPQ